MIYFKTSISNPWSNRFANIFCKAGGTPFKNKFWEVELLKTNQLIGFEFSLTTRCDHAGVFLEVGLLGFSLSINFYDNRHWNDNAGRYNIYTEEGGYF